MILLISYIATLEERRKLQFSSLEEHAFLEWRKEGLEMRKKMVFHESSYIRTEFEDEIYSDPNMKWKNINLYLNKIIKT